MADRDSWGHALERAAAMHILETGDYRLLRENYTARTGEIDLIFEFYGREPAEYRRPAPIAERFQSPRPRRIELVFVEVKGRRGWNNGIESVDWVKRRKLALTAKRFLEWYRGPAGWLRFDVIVWERGRWVWFQDAWRDDGSR
jgi:Holliday junction resolvase-like predicted endonuclease